MEPAGALDIAVLPGNQNAATVATDPISDLESPGLFFSEPTAGTTAARRR